MDYQHFRFFRRVGKPSAQRRAFNKSNQVASAITKERVSRLEGSFGKEKEHYHLKKIKARTRAAKILWIFFGIHTAYAPLSTKTSKTGTSSHLNIRRGLYQLKMPPNHRI